MKIQVLLGKENAPIFARRLDYFFVSASIIQVAECIMVAPG